MEKFLSVFRNAAGERKVLAAYDAVMENVDRPLEERYVPTRLGETHVLITGKEGRPPLLLVHAYYATAASWYKNLPALSERFRVYALDLIGDPNKSRPLQVVRDAGEFVQWFRDVMDALFIERADFIGNSVGAFHIVNFARQAPERIRKMVLIGPAATFLPIIPFYVHTFPGGMTGWTPLVRHAVRWIENNAPFDPAFRELFYLNLKYGKAVNQVFPRVFTDEELRQIDIPTLVLYGSGEVIYDYTQAIDRAKKLMNNVHTVIIGGANHLTAATNAEMTNNALLEFL